MVRPIRAQRIAERIRNELLELIYYDITDPALEGVTITGVTVDRELAFAKVFVADLEGGERKDEILAGFNRASGFLRYQLSQRIELRSFPQLRFKWDPTPARADRIEKLIASLHSDDAPADSDEGQVPEDSVDD